MGAPGWRGVFDRVERAVGAPLEQAVASSHFGTAMTLWISTSRVLDRAVRRRIDHHLANVLHLLNMPSRTDVQRLSRQMAAMNAEVRALSLPTERITRYLVELQQQSATPVGPGATRQPDAPQAAALPPGETQDG